MKKRKPNKSDQVFFLELCRKYGLSAVYLFGSQVRKHQSQLSDIDLAYLPKKAISMKREADLYVQVIRYFKRDDIDMVNLDEASVALRYEVVREGYLLACLDEEAVYDFVVSTRRVYLDTAPLRKLQYDYLKERILTNSFAE
jgi:predicted nucleotidyltransferase